MKLLPLLIWHPLLISQENYCGNVKLPYVQSILKRKLKPGKLRQTKSIYKKLKNFPEFT